MSLLSRLFRQVPPPPKAVKKLDERIADLQRQSAEFIVGVALNGDEQALRVAAIEKLGVGETLFNLADDAGGHGAMQRAARRRVAQLIDSNALDFAEYCRRTSNASTILAVAAFCSDPARLQQAITSIHDPGLLSTLAVDGPSTKVRQLAAEAITDPAQLKQLLKDTRGKDKNVYRIIKHKCDALHAEEKAAAETQAHITTLCSALERHRRQPYDNLFEPTLEHLSSQWAAVAAQAPPDIRARAEQAIDHCRELVAQHAQAMADQAARARAIAKADGERHEVLDDLRSLLAALYEQRDENTDQQLSQYTDRWTAIDSYKSAGRADQTTFIALCKAITELPTLIAQLGSLSLQSGHFRDALPDADLAAHAQALRDTLRATSLLGDAIPAQASEAAAALQAWEQSRHDKQAAEANAVRQLSGLIRKAGGVLSDGKTGQAAGLRRAIEERLQALPAPPPHLSTQLQQLDEKLHLLQDWRSYAVAPKRIELIEQMEALIGSEDDPQVLADNIKRLQDEWKLISKGNTENTDAEWQRFHLAGQTAYQPCREHFAAQARAREENLEKRKALLSRLSDFVAEQNWEQADWREVARALRESRQQWRIHQPVERAPNKPLQEQFDALTSDLQSRLDTEFAKNAEEKKALIARVQDLLASEDSRQAIDEVKRLQLAWKNVGIVAREDDQKLWKEFRKHCDAVFARRQQQHTEYEAALEENSNKAIALCEEAEQVLALSGPELPEGAKKLSALRETFNTIGELPKASVRDLQNRFDRALERFEGKVAQQRVRDKAQAWDNLLDAGDKVRLYRLAGNAEQCAELKQAAQVFIDGVQHWPKGGLQAIRSELAKDGTTDIVANEAALRTLCIRAEILTDTPTPPADQQLRRDYQVQRLMQGMGQARGPVRDELDAMVLEWVGIGATSTPVYSELLARFNHCRNQHQNN